MNRRRNQGSRPGGGTAMVDGVHLLPPSAPRPRPMPKPKPYGRTDRTVAKGHRGGSSPGPSMAPRYRSYDAAAHGRDDQGGRQERWARRGNANAQNTAAAATNTATTITAAASQEADGAGRKTYRRRRNNNNNNNNNRMAPRPADTNDVTPHDVGGSAAVPALHHQRLYDDITGTMLAWAQGAGVSTASAAADGDDDDDDVDAMEWQREQVFIIPADHRKMTDDELLLLETARGGTWDLVAPNELSGPGLSLPLPSPLSSLPSSLSLSLSSSLPSFPSPLSSFPSSLPSLPSSLSSSPPYQLLECESDAVAWARQNRHVLFELADQLQHQQQQKQHQRQQHHHHYHRHQDQHQHQHQQQQQHHQSLSRGLQRAQGLAASDNRCMPPALSSRLPPAALALPTPCVRKHC